MIAVLNLNCQEKKAKIIIPKPNLSVVNLYKLTKQINFYSEILIKKNI